MIMLLLTIFFYAISWLIICGIIKLICLCFGWAFSLAIATGIWIIICALKLIFGGNNK